VDALELKSKFPSRIRSMSSCMDKVGEGILERKKLKLFFKVKGKERENS